MKTIKFGKYQGVVEDDIFEQESFNLDTDSGDLVEIKRKLVQDDAEPYTTLGIVNGMNGYGENIYEEIKELTVEVFDGPFSEKVGESLESLLQGDGESLSDQEQQEQDMEAAANTVNQPELNEENYQSESPAETLDQVEKAEVAWHGIGSEGEYVYFKMAKDFKTEKVFFTGEARTDEDINNYFEEKCGGVYEWIRASDVSENHGGEFEDESN